MSTQSNSPKKKSNSATKSGTAQKKPSSDTLMWRPETDQPEYEAQEETRLFKECYDRIQSGFIPWTFSEYYAHKNPEPIAPCESDVYKGVAKQVGITRFMKIKANLLFSKKAEQELETLEQKASSITTELYKRKIGIYNEKAKKYYNEKKRLTKRMELGIKSTVEQYFQYILKNDRFCIEPYQQYLVDTTDFSFDKRDKVLSFHYRIPLANEIRAITHFEYNAKSDMIEAKEMKKADKVQYRLCVARKVLLRAATLVFASDEYRHIERVKIYGFLNYPIADTWQIANVISVVIARTDLNLNLDTVRVNELFETKFNEQHSKGLYTQEPYTLIEV